ncbi:MAG: FAD-dependent oxidoreductase [Proteobacteria bacterium]|nr:FAD-dependent oxidoreductase [Pseudomonadota bacterium]
MVEHVVIVGGGQAAVQAVDVLRRKGFKGELSLVGEEPTLPYQRPPLSKKYLSGALERERLAIRPETYYAGHAVKTWLGRRAVQIERAAQRLRLDDGSTLPYDALLLATGSLPRPLPAPGVELAGVHFLRTMADADRIRAQWADARNVVVIGGGYIGLETAATARGLGKEVTVIEMADRVMNRVTSPELSAFYEAEHARHGVRIVNNEKVQELRGDAGRVRSVITASGAEHPADVVIVGVGVLPADQLAREAGLACDNGILSDEHCRTSDPNIYAAGDCANHPNRHYGRRMRLESVDNAFEQAGTAALNILGDVTPHDKLPWFWSDQYDLKLVIVGVCTGYDTAVLRGSPAQRSFSVCYLRDGEFIAIDTVNAPKDQIAARKLIGAHGRPDSARLADPSVALKDLA